MTRDTGVSLNGAKRMEDFFAAFEFLRDEERLAGRVSISFRVQQQITSGAKGSLRRKGRHQPSNIKCGPDQIRSS